MVKRSARFSLVFTALVLVLQACSLPGTATPMLGEPPLGPLTLYVSTSGNDDNDCLSEASSCLTLYRALTISTPGSTIHIGPGEFLRGGGFNPRHDLTLQGAGIDQTVLTSPTGDVIQLARPSTSAASGVQLAWAATSGPTSSVRPRRRSSWPRRGRRMLRASCRFPRSRLYLPRR